MSIADNVVPNKAVDEIVVTARDRLLVKSIAQRFELGDSLSLLAAYEDAARHRLAAVQPWVEMVESVLWQLRGLNIALTDTGNIDREDMARRVDKAFGEARALLLKHQQGEKGEGNE